MKRRVLWTLVLVVAFCLGGLVMYVTNDDEAVLRRQVRQSADTERATTAKVADNNDTIQELRREIERLRDLLIVFGVDPAVVAPPPQPSRPPVTTAPSTPTTTAPPVTHVPIPLPATTTAPPTTTTTSPPLACLPLVGCKENPA